MTRDVNRREFLGAASVAALALGLPVHGLIADDTMRRWLPASAPRPRASPFDLHDVRLRPGIQLTGLETNRRFMMGLDPDRLLHMFRVTAGIPSSAEPLGGWEAPDNELRGHFTGHYLSACALMGAQTGDAEVKARGTLIVAELAKCQASLGNGYLSAFPEELFDRLRAGKPAWAPFYTLHKIMAGLLDTHVLSG